MPAFWEKTQNARVAPSSPGTCRGLSLTSHWQPLPFEFRFVPSTSKAPTLPFPVSPLRLTAWCCQHVGSGGWVTGGHCHGSRYFQSLATLALSMPLALGTLWLKKAISKGRFVLHLLRLVQTTWWEAHPWACGQALRIQHVPPSLLWIQSRIWGSQSGAAFIGLSLMV